MLGLSYFQQNTFGIIYLKLETTEFSEYLTWYVLNDKDVRIGCIDLKLQHENHLVNLSVDLKEDLDRCKDLLNRINPSKFEDIKLHEILANIEGLEKVDDTKEIKLPLGNKIRLKDYLNAFNEKSYVVRKELLV